LRTRYSPADAAILTARERSLFGPLDSDSFGVTDRLAWELLYRLEPELYAQFAGAERLHPAILGWLPERVDRAVEVAAGSGRLTVPLAARCRELLAIEPAAQLRQTLASRLAGRRLTNVRVAEGFLDDLPIPDSWADLVICCSALTPEPCHGGDSGLEEMERVCRPGGLVVVVWPTNPQWLHGRGYVYESFPGEMSLNFESHAEAVELCSIFYPHAVTGVSRLVGASVPYGMVGVNPPRDLAWKRIADA
jgi:SAM-dependent methyltransferase